MSPTLKTHVCSHCKKTFSTHGHLSRHARIHTGEMNYACSFPGCTTRCARKDNLRQHYRLHFDIRDPEELRRLAPTKKRRKTRVARVATCDVPVRLLAGDPKSTVGASASTAPDPAYSLRAETLSDSSTTGSTCSDASLSPRSAPYESPPIYPSPLTPSPTTFSGRLPPVELYDGPGVSASFAPSLPQSQHPPLPHRAPNPIHASYAFVRTSLPSSLLLDAHPPLSYDTSSVHGWRPHPAQTLPAEIYPASLPPHSQPPPPGPRLSSSYSVDFSLPPNTLVPRYNYHGMGNRSNAAMPVPHIHQTHVITSLASHTTGQAMIHLGDTRGYDDRILVVGTDRITDGLMGSR